MTRQEHLLTHVLEECVEIAQRTTKAMRFGLFEIQPAQLQSNRQRIIDEYNDLIAVMDMLGMNVVDPMAIEAKKRKVEKYLAYAKECGTLTEDGV